MGRVVPALTRNRWDRLQKKKKKPFQWIAKPRAEKHRAADPSPTPRAMTSGARLGGSARLPLTLQHASIPPRENLQVREPSAGGFGISDPSRLRPGFLGGRGDPKASKTLKNAGPDDKGSPSSRSSLAPWGARSNERGFGRILLEPLVNKKMLKSAL